MQVNFEHIQNQLKESGFKKTPQRMAILGFLDGNLDHPTAQQIYKKLKPDYPSLSRATVYNTLQILVDLNLIKEHKFSKNRVHFDPDTSPHHHFICESCDHIIDVHENLTEDFFSFPTNHQVDRVNLTAYGICQNCL